MEPIFFSCFPLTSIWKITCEKDEIWLGEETKGAPLLFGFFFARKVMGNGRKRRRGKRLRRHFAIKPRKEGGQKPASPPPPLLLSLCRTKSGGHCLAEVDVDDVDRRVVKCSSDGRREIIKCPVRKGRKPLLYLLSDSEPIPPYPTVGHFFGKLPFGAFGGNDLFLLCFSYFFLFPSMASQLYTFCSSFLAVPVSSHSSVSFPPPSFFSGVVRYRGPKPKRLRCFSGLQEENGRAARQNSGTRKRRGGGEKLEGKKLGKVTEWEKDIRRRGKTGEG